MSATYDGSFKTIHTILPKETLSNIAIKYGFGKNWKPVWIYNTKIQKILGSNPDVIPVGAKIWIPRSEEGYKKLIKKFEQLKNQMEEDRMKFDAQLDGDHYNHMATRELFNFAGDVATIIGRTAVMAGKAASLLNSSKNLLGQEKLATQYLAKVETENLTKYLRGNLVDNIIQYVNSDAGDFKKGVVNPVKDGIKNVRTVSLKGGKSFLDISEMILDQVNISSFSDLLMGQFMGENTGQTYSRAKQGVAHTVQQSCRNLDEKIKNYTEEIKLLYNSDGQ
ncbi:hypothetical protein BH23BAC1_BH23BAC1_25370 [soil metagenome]